MKKKDNLIKIILFTVLIIVILGVILLINLLNSDVLENHTFYQHFIGKKYTYEGSLKITKKNGVTELICENTQIQLDSMPVYYADINNKAIFPEDMAIVLPQENGRMAKINRFSKIYKNDSEIYLEMDKKEKRLSNAFLYDGKDIYFFLDYAKIYIDEVAYDVTPLSYVKVRYNESVEIYNKAEDKCKIIETTDKNVTAEAEGYKINLSIDALKIGEKEQLLLNRVSDLNNLEM